MDAEERKQYAKEQKEWEETKKDSRHRDDALEDVGAAMTTGGTTEDQVERAILLSTKVRKPFTR